VEVDLPQYLSFPKGWNMSYSFLTDRAIVLRPSSFGGRGFEFRAHCAGPALRTRQKKSRQSRGQGEKANQGQNVFSGLPMNLNTFG
jgi:hypothetical protein